MVVRQLANTPETLILLEYLFCKQVYYCDTPVYFCNAIAKFEIYETNKFSAIHKGIAKTVNNGGK
jgi:hypothetical protein